MEHKDLIPVTYQITLSLPEKSNLIRWGDIVRYFLSLYAEQLCQKKGVYIGHIKAIYPGAENSFIKVNIYKCEIPAGVVIKGQTETDSMEITVNSLVYGASEKDSLAAVQYVSKVLQKEFMVKTEYVLKKSHKEAKHYGHSHHK